METPKGTGACPRCGGSKTVDAPTKKDPARKVVCGACGGSGKSSQGPGGTGYSTK